MSLKRAILATLLAFALVAPAWAGCEVAAEARDEYLLGELYYREQDFDKAAKSFRCAAEQGHAEAQFRLGNLYDGGSGVQRDQAEAVKWYREAAQQGHARAQSYLGARYEDGSGGAPKNHGEAFKWTSRAADQGIVSAQSNLGDMYREGVGVPQDFVQAHMWYNIAAALGGIWPQGTDFVDTRRQAIRVFLDRSWREVAASQRDELAKQMTPDQVAEAQRLAREWWEKRQKAD
jgi:TPR repeat protein